MKCVVIYYGDDRSISCELLRMIWNHRDGAVIFYSGTTTVYGNFDGALLYDGATLVKSVHDVNMLQLAGYGQLFSRSMEKLDF